MECLSCKKAFICAVKGIKPNPALSCKDYEECGKNTEINNQIRRINKTSQIKTIIPFMAGRPKRDLSIQKDDVTNLKIELNTEQKFDTFLERM